MATARPERSARERLERVLFLACGIGAIIFGGLLMGGGGGILAQHDQLAPWYAYAVVSVAVLIPVSFVALAYTINIRLLRLVAGLTALAFVVLQILWVPAMTVPVLDGDATPWLQGINALHATILAVVWQRRVVWLYPLAQGPIVAVTQIIARDGAVRASILDGLGAMIFCLILMGVAIAVVSAADRQDAAGERARHQASLEASRRTRERERARINAIVHDDIMSVLLAAGRDTDRDQLAKQAQIALKSVATLTEERPETRDYSPEETVAVLRNAVTDVVSGVDFTYDLDGGNVVPTEVVAALSEALGEAMRNSVLHAGQAHRTVDVSVSDEQIAVTAQDNGAGFSTKSVSQRRLGIRVSIVGRMRSLNGGSARVVSRPGRGTTVTLTWRRS